MKEFLIIKVGSEDRPAGDSDIENVRLMFQQFCERSELNIDCFVTHHAVELQYFPKRRSFFGRMIQGWKNLFYTPK